MLRKKKMVSLIVTTMILIGTLGTSSYGASTYEVPIYANPTSKTLKAFYGTSRIIIDGENVTTAIEPFVVDGTTYIPLRAVANAFNKNVHWNQLTSTATITDDLTQVDNYYQTEILKRDVEIMNLRREVEKLEKELEEDKEIDLDDLEDDLNDEFDEYRDIEFEITLDGKTSDVEVKIEVDLDDYEDEWDDLSTSRKTTYLQNIVDEIHDNYKDAKVEGYVRDTDAKKTILEFTTDRKGKVDIDSKSVEDLDDLEDELNDDYYRYFSDIKLDVKLDGDEDKVKFYVELDYDRHKREWDKLSDSKVEDLMIEIYSYIEDELEDAYIRGYVYDTDGRKQLARYQTTSSGRDDFERY